MVTELKNPEVNCGSCSWILDPNIPQKIQEILLYVKTKCLLLFDTGEKYTEQFGYNFVSSEVTGYVISY